MIVDDDIHSHYARSGHTLTTRHEVNPDITIGKLIFLQIVFVIIYDKVMNNSG